MIECVAKICNTCGTEKPLSEYSKCVTSKDGLQKNCKLCQADLVRLWKRNNPERQYRIDSRYYQKNKDVIKQRSRDVANQDPVKNCEKARLHYAKNKHKDKAVRLLRQYGITPLEYDRRYQIQGGKCGVCGQHQTELKRALTVDHDHKTGHVRGLLCDGCNGGLGFFRDSVERLEKAIRYLREN